MQDLNHIYMLQRRAASVLQSRSAQRGSISLMLVSGIIVLAATAQIIGSGQMSQSQNSILSVRTATARDALAEQMRRYSKMPATYRNSLDPDLPSDINRILRSCVLGNAAAGATPCLGDGATEHPLSLYAPVPSGLNPQLIAGPGPVGSPNARPAIYDSKGNLCQSNTIVATAECPFEVYATFVASCPPAGPAICMKADAISIHYVVRAPLNLLGAATSQGGVKLAEISLAAPPMNTAQILPPPNNYVPQYNQTTLVVGTPATTTITQTTSPPVSPIQIALEGIGITKLSITTAIEGSGVTDPGLAVTIADWTYNQQNVTSASAVGAISTIWQQDSGLASAIAVWAGNQNNTPSATSIASVAAAVAGVTDPVIAQGIASAGVSDPALATQISTAVAGMTNPMMITALASNSITDPVLANGIANAASGITDPMIVDAVVSAAIVDPVIANGVAGAIGGAGIKDPKLAKIIAKAQILNPTSAKFIKTAGIKDPVTAGAISQAGITNISIAAGIGASGAVMTASTATAINSAITQAGITNYDIAYQAARQGLTSAAAVTTLANTMIAAQAAADAAKAAAAAAKAAAKVAAAVAAAAAPPKVTTVSNSGTGSTSSGTGNSGKTATTTATANNTKSANTTTTTTSTTKTTVTTSGGNSGSTTTTATSSGKGNILVVTTSGGGGTSMTTSNGGSQVANIINSIVSMIGTCKANQCLALGF